MKRLQVAYVLIVTVIGILFIFRESVNIYWMQTYHADSPLMAIERMILGHDDVENAENINIAGINTIEAQKIPDKEATEKMKAEQLLKAAEAARKAAELAEIEAQNADPYRFLKPDDTRPIAGPNLPQLPGEVVLEAGDKLFFVGDSLMQGVAPRVRQTLYKNDSIDGVDLSKQSTGLAYPNFFNWPKVVAETLAKDAGIEAIIVYLGANDPWDFPVPGRKSYLRFKSAEWERAYRERVRSILLSANQYNLPVIWLGAPCMRKDKLHQDMVYLNTIYQSEVESFKGTYIPTSDILGCSDEAYDAYVQGDKGSQKVRTNDGIHFTPTGQRLISERVIEALTIIRPELEEVSDVSLEEHSEISEVKGDISAPESAQRSVSGSGSGSESTSVQPPAKPLAEKVPVSAAKLQVSQKSEVSQKPTVARNADTNKEQVPPTPKTTQSGAKPDIKMPVSEPAQQAHIQPVQEPNKAPNKTASKASVPVTQHIKKDQLQWADGTEVNPSTGTDELKEIYPSTLDIWYTE